MEENQSGLFGMHLDDNGRLLLKETARWSRFIAIVGFVGLGILILALVAASASIAPVIQRFYGLNAEGLAGLAIAFAFFVLVILLVLVVMLYRFSVLTRRGIDTQDQVLFNSGLNCLKIYFLISGILALISLVSTIYNTITAL